MILDVRLLKEITVSQAQQEETRGRYGREQRKWGKLAVYISRAITIIMQDYNSFKIRRRLDELAKKVKVLETKSHTN